MNLSNQFEQKSNTFTISSDQDVVNVRKFGRQLAQEQGYSATDQTLIAVAISETARNILEYAGTGTIEFNLIQNELGIYIEILARDKGPGIVDVNKAMMDGFSTGRGMGIGLPGTKRIMDEFEIESEEGHGTTITMRKWKR